MAVIDYGAILLINGKKYNDSLFMESSDCGFVPDKAYSSKYDYWMDIKGNYFVYAGDDAFMIVFYKTWAHIISCGEIVFSTSFNMMYPGETRYFDELPTVKFEHLDKKKYKYSWHDNLSLKDYIEVYGRRQGSMYYYRMIKRNQRNKSLEYKQRYVASWYYKGKKYEVIYGYGIDPDKNVWERIRNSDYGFTDNEIRIINRCFE